MFIIGNFSKKTYTGWFSTVTHPYNFFVFEDLQIKFATLVLVPILPKYANSHLFLSPPIYPEKKINGALRI